MCVKVYGTNQKHALRFPLFVHFVDIIGDVNLDCYRFLFAILNKILPLVLKKINNSSKLFYTLGLLRNSIIDENNFI
jgi:hypothetical protein